MNDRTVTWSLDLEDAEALWEYLHHNRPGGYQHVHDGLREAIARTRALRDDIPTLDAMRADEIEKGMRLRMPTGQIMRVTHVDKPKPGEVGSVQMMVETMEVEEVDD